MPFLRNPFQLQPTRCHAFRASNSATPTTKNLLCGRKDLNLQPEVLTGLSGSCCPFKQHEPACLPIPAPPHQRTPRR